MSKGKEEGEEESSISKTIIAIAENRARELCLAKINLGQISQMDIYVIPDSHTYGETLNSLALADPDEILLHDGTKNTVLSKKISAMFDDDSNARVVYLTRSLFDQDRGAELLKKIVSGINRVDSGLMAKYTVLAASFCLIRYVETVQGISFAENSLKLCFLSGQQNRMSIDRRTVTALEIIGNVRDGNQHDSLFGSINRTQTKIGERLLRANLLRPINEMATLDTRLDTVEFLMQQSHVYNSISKILRSFPDLDSMLSGLCVVQNKVGIKSTRKDIDTLLMLKSVIIKSEELVHILRDSLQHKQELAERDSDVRGDNNNDISTRSHDLLHAIVDTLTDPSMTVIHDAINEIITEEASYHKNSYAMRQQECFAVKEGLSQVLDVARKLLIDSVDSIEAIAVAYEMSLSVPVKVNFSPNRGYYLHILTDSAHLPEEFIQPIQNKKWISCTTAEISTLSRRAVESTTNCLNLTSELLQGAHMVARANSEALYSLADGVALLDMLGGFANVVTSSSEPFCRPTLKAEGAMVVTKARHIISSTSAKARGASLSKPYVPNDISISEDGCFQVVTGPNGSGKTLYIKQIALIVVMAQVGMFVPAVQCEINLRDRILSRMGSAESIEHGVSSFDGEMRETSYILQNVTSSSLVVIDELGKSTGLLDGISIAFSVAEELISSGAFTFFVTHFPQLTMLAHMYPNARNLHLATDLENKLEFLHVVSHGPCDIKHGYGVAMAEICGFSPGFISQAKDKMEQVKQTFPLLMGSSKVDQCIMAATTILMNLQSLEMSSMDASALEEFKGQIRRRIPPETRDGIVSMLDRLDAAERQQQRTDATTAGGTALPSVPVDLAAPAPAAREKLSHHVIPPQPNAATVDANRPSLEPDDDDHSYLVSGMGAPRDLELNMEDLDSTEALQQPASYYGGKIKRTNAFQVETGMDLSVSRILAAKHHQQEKSNKL